jgi:Polysaccharide deacetylase
LLSRAGGRARLVSLDEAVLRLQEGDDRRFVCFTFDDGYRDNLQYAYPMFKRRLMLLTLYVPTDHPDGNGELWWRRPCARDRASPERRAVAAAGGHRAGEDQRLRGDLLVAAPSAKWYACSPTDTRWTWRRTAPGS